MPIDINTKPDPASADAKLDKRTAFLAASFVGVAGIVIVGTALALVPADYDREVKTLELDAGLLQGDQVTDLLSEPVDKDGVVATRVVLPLNRAPGSVYLTGPSAGCFDQVEVATVLEHNAPAAEVTAHNTCDEQLRFTALLTLEVAP